MRIALFKCAHLSLVIFIFSYNLVRITQFSALRFMDAQFLVRLEFNLLSLMRTYFIALIFCIFSLMQWVQCN